MEAEESDPLEPELQTELPIIGTGDQTQVPCRNSECFHSC